MLLLFKKKKIVVDTFTYRAEIFDNFAIKKSANFYPDWWKQTKSYYTTYEDIELQVPTIKKCFGLIELYKKGFILPLWSDLKIDTTEYGNYSYLFSCGFGNIEYHDSQQFNKIFDRFIHIKLISPWHFQEKKGVKFMLSTPKWNHLNNDMNFIDVLPGCVDFKNQTTSNINMFLPKENNKFLLPYNTPLAQFIPISDKEIVLKNHLISEDEWNHKTNKNAPISFLNQYQTKLALSKKNSKCPLGF